eukprot:35949-Eustigmatos_ZCMA.PRE.1
MACTARRRLQRYEAHLHGTRRAAARQRASPGARRARVRGCGRAISTDSGDAAAAGHRGQLCRWEEGAADAGHA